MRGYTTCSTINDIPYQIPLSLTSGRPIFQRAWWWLAGKQASGTHIHVSERQALSKSSFPHKNQCNAIIRQEEKRVTRKTQNSQTLLSPRLNRQQTHSHESDENERARRVNRGLWFGLAGEDADEWGAEAADSVEGGCDACSCAALGGGEDFGGAVDGEFMSVIIRRKTSFRRRIVSLQGQRPKRKNCCEWRANERRKGKTY